MAMIPVAMMILVVVGSAGPIDNGVGDGGEFGSGELGSGEFECVALANIIEFGAW